MRLQIERLRDCRGDHRKHRHPPCAGRRSRRCLLRTDVSEKPAERNVKTRYARPHHRHTNAAQPTIGPQVRNHCQLWQIVTDFLTHLDMNIKGEQSPPKCILCQSRAAGYFLQAIWYFYNGRRKTLVSHRYYCRKHIHQAAEEMGKPILWLR